MKCNFFAIIPKKLLTSYSFYIDFDTDMFFNFFEIGGINDTEIQSKEPSLYKK